MIEYMDTIKPIFDWINLFFLIYLIGYSTFLFLSVVVGSTTLYKRKIQDKLMSKFTQNYFIPISIVVPAHNEEVTVVETVKSLLALDYKLYEIIVVDDGSTDSTAQKLIEAYEMKPVSRPIHKQIGCQLEESIYESYSQKIPLTLIKKKNGGKADALNMGINAAQYPYFICMDADSVLQYDSLKKIVYPLLEEDNVIAVGGAIRPSNNVDLYGAKVRKYRLPKKILPCMQLLEYDRSFLASRILFDKFNGSLIISGAFGLFKKDIVIAAGGYDQSTVGEDMELVVKLHKYCLSNQVPYSIKYATDAICWSQVPESLNDLKKQRKRWHLGLFQTMWKHRAFMINPKFGSVSLISYLYFLFYELLSPFIEIFGVFTMLAAFSCSLLNLPFMIMFLLIYAAYNSILTLTAFFSRIQTIDLTLRFSDCVKAILLCFFEVTCLRFIMAFVRLTAFNVSKKKKNVWGEIKRKKINI